MKEDNTQYMTVNDIIDSIKSKPDLNYEFFDEGKIKIWIRLNDQYFNTKVNGIKEAEAVLDTLVKYHRFFKLQGYPPDEIMKSCGIKAFDKNEKKWLTMICYGGIQWSWINNIKKNVRWKTKIIRIKSRFFRAVLRLIGMNHITIKIFDSV